MEQPIPTFKLASARLRPWRRTDILSLTTFGADPSLYPYMLSFFPRDYSRHDAVEYLDWATAAGMHHLAIEVDGVAVGGVGVCLLGGVFERSAEVSYWINSRYRRRGIVSSALQVFLPHVFQTLGIERIAAMVVPGNAASSQLLESLGFQLEGCLRRIVWRDGQYIDLNVFSLLRDEFRSL